MKKIILLIVILILSACSSTNTRRNRKVEFRREKIMAFHSQWKGVAYRLGGNTKNGIDCSALMQILYRDKFGINLPRTTATQVKKGRRVSKNNLEVGDLIFFRTSPNTRHVGVYIGDNEFLHASTSRGVMIAPINNYWSNIYWQSRRIL